MLDGARDRFAHGVVAVGLEQRVELLDASAGEPRLTVRDLGEECECGGSEVEDLLPLLVELGALAMDGGDLRGSMLRQGRRRLALLSTPMLGLEPPGNDAEALLVKEQGPRDERRLGGHRVGHPPRTSPRPSVLRRRGSAARAFPERP